MKSSCVKLVLQCLILCSTFSQYVTWGELPSLRAGQIESVQSLMTSEDISPNITDQSVSFINPMTALTSDLRAGVSLMSYQSWMTDAFSYNITVTYFDCTGLTVRFQVLGNTFFSSAKVHYIVLWRSNSPDNGPSKTYNLQVLFGCYLTADLLVGDGNRSKTVGNLTTSIPSNTTYVVVKSMIAGMQMTNSVGVNNYIAVTTNYASGSNLLQHVVVVENNCFLQFVCLTSLILDTNTGDNFDIQIIQFKTSVLTATNAGLTTVSYMARYDGTSRMFFGFSTLNVSMSDSRYLNVETANISLVSLLYDKNQAMNQVVYNMFFFALRSCPNSTYQLYNPDTYDCNSTCPATGYVPTGTAPDTFCMPCHYSCLTCAVGNSSSSCSTCNPNISRIAAPSGGVCSCISGFADAGIAQCSPCNATLAGCAICNSPTVCTTCIDNVIYNINGTTGKCDCAPLTYMASGYCLTYPGCLTARKFINNISCDACDTANNFILQSNFTCQCNLGFQLNMLANPIVCYHNCGNGETPVGTGLCDDGNNMTGDGCTNCTIDSGYHCTYQIVNNVPGVSNCTPKVNVVITYLYAQRFINSNHFIMAFSLSPTQAGLNAGSFSSNFDTSLPISSSSITYDTSSQTIYLEGDYDQSIEGTFQSANVTFNSMPFYADPIQITFTAIGSNAELVLQSYNTPNQFLQYIIMGMSVYGVLLAIFAAVVGLKLVGIELLVPMQLIYFSLATLSNQSTYSYVLSNLKYANGFSTIQPYNYYRTHSQSRNLIGMSYQTEFLLSINVMLVLYILILIWLLIHHLRLKYKEYKLQQFLQDHAPAQEENRSHDSQEEKQNLDQDEQKAKLTHRKRQNNDMQEQQSKLREDHHRSFKVFTFEVDRVYFIFYLILLNQMMFSFIIMTLNVPITIFFFPQEINVLACNFIFFIYIGNIVFISYDQESNKMIAFASISDRYAYVYFLIDFIIIIVLSMTFQLKFSIYLVCVLSVAFLLLIIKQRPYSSVLLTFENIVAMYLHVMLVISLILLCVMGSSNSNERAQLVQSYMIVALIFIGQVLTTIRVIIKVNFKKAFDDLKNPNDNDNSDKKAKKIIEKDLDLLEKENHMEIIPPDSVRNGLLTPKDKMVDWESKNTDEYESLKHENQNHETKQGPDNEHPNNDHHNQEGSEIKDENLNQLQLLKKKLRNNLKLKQEASALSKKEK